MFPDSNARGYYAFRDYSGMPDDKQNAATTGAMIDAQGNGITGHKVIAIDTTLLNDTNNTVEKVLASVRFELESVDRKRKAQ